MISRFWTERKSQMQLFKKLTEIKLITLAGHWFFFLLININEMAFISNDSNPCTSEDPCEKSHERPSMYFDHYQKSNLRGVILADSHW